MFFFVLLFQIFFSFFMLGKNERYFDNAILQTVQKVFLADVIDIKRCPNSTFMLR